MLTDKLLFTELNESYERFAILAQTTQDVVWDWDLRTGRVWWSQALQTHFGYLASQIEPGLEWWRNRLHPEDKERVWEHIHQVIKQGGATWSDQYRFQRADGSYALIYDRGSTLQEQGKLVRIVGSMQDVTLQKQAELELERRVQQRTLALMETNALLSQAQSIAHVGNYVIILDPIRITFSDEMYRIWGYEPGALEITPEFVDTHTHPDDVPLMQGKLAQARLDHQSYTYSLRIYRPDGQLRHINMHNQIVCDPTGQAIKVLGTGQDITEQVWAQQKLQQTTQNLQAVLDSSPAAIGLLKPVFNAQVILEDFQVQVCNQQMAWFARRSLEELADQLITSIYPNLRVNGWFAYFVEVLQTGNDFYREYPSPHDADRWLAISISRYNQDIVVTVLDITALKESQQQQQHWLTELNQAQAGTQALQALVQQRGELLRAASHDLRGNLGIISGAAHLLNLVSSQEERLHMLDMVRRNIEQATQMLTDLLDYARLEAGQEKVKVASFDVAQLLKHISRSVEPLATEKGLVVTVRGPSQLLIRSDSLNVRRIAQNLILNAIKYTASGQVTVSWDADAALGKWWFIVQDTGLGLPDELLRILMDIAVTFPQGQFETANPPRAPSPKLKVVLPSEGIGLRIVRQLVTLLKAQLQVESLPGKGTTFTVSLPLN